ncbi:hypothetical protein ZWY2020_048346 [Hordeum vulgare]|nr:hypothetical protein ZWY2020_048346 [Hordeum vulgare]
MASMAALIAIVVFFGMHGTRGPAARKRLSANGDLAATIGRKLGGRPRPAALVGVTATPPTPPSSSCAYRRRARRPHPPSTIGRLTNLRCCPPRQRRVRPSATSSALRSLRLPYRQRHLRRHLRVSGFMALGGSCSPTATVGPHPASSEGLARSARQIGNALSGKIPAPTGLNTTGSAAPSKRSRGSPTPWEPRCLTRAAPSPFFPSRRCARMGPNDKPPKKKKKVSTAIVGIIMAPWLSRCCFSHLVFCKRSGQRLTAQKRSSGQRNNKTPASSGGNANTTAEPPGDEHEPRDNIDNGVHVDAQPSSDKDVEIEPAVDLDNPQPRNKRYDKNDFIARKHGKEREPCVQKPMPFPPKPSKKKDDEDFERFVEMIRPVFFAVVW